MSRHLLEATEQEIALRRKRAHVHLGGTFGERLADSIAVAIGSWRFLIIQTAIVVAWCVLNTAGWFVWHWDAYPFILLNLAFSTQAAYTGPVLLLASNRQSQKDRARDDRDDAEIGAILEIARDLHRMQTDQMDSHKTQTTLLKQLVGNAK